MAVCKEQVPLVLCLIVGGNSDTELAVRYVIHKGQRLTSKPTSNKVVLDQDKFPTYTSCFCQHRIDIFHMMKNINHHHNINGLRFEREFLTVVVSSRNHGVFANGRIDCTQLQIWSQLHNGRCNSSITTTNIQDRKVAWNQLCKMRSQDSDSTRMDQCTMKMSKQVSVLGAFATRPLRAMQ